MKYIKLFENFNRETENRLNDILDKISKGETLSQHEKDTLSNISKTDNTKTFEDEIMDWLNSKYGNLESDIDTYKSFGKMKSKMVLYDRNDAESYFEVEMKQNNIAHADYNIFKQLYSYYNISEIESSRILSIWLLKTYKVSVKEVKPLFKNEF